MTQIPHEVYERVIDRYPADILDRLHVLLEMRDNLRANGLKVKNKLLEWHDKNVREEFEKTKWY